MLETSLFVLSAAALSAAADYQHQVSLTYKRYKDWYNLYHRGRQLTMRFHPHWQHYLCPVMAWYREQCSSSTRFRTIEHRKSTKAPFFHEFILLRLTDGAVCRVERMGNGSRFAALKAIGTTPNDQIQWFARDYLAEAVGVSECISMIDLGRELDILDVLSICYSIQRGAKSGKYTLQRYNCYFLCLTLIDGLSSRGIAHTSPNEPLPECAEVAKYIDRRIQAHARRVGKFKFLAINAKSIPAKLKWVMRNVRATTPTTNRRSLADLWRRN